MSNEEDGNDKKIQFPQYFQKQKQQGGEDNPNGTPLKTPVLRGVVRVCLRRPPHLGGGLR
nr:MAG: hypothetical protein J07AB56_06270 [Candidatus Nanosalinarum sp. J07AB56]